MSNHLHILAAIDLDLSASMVLETAIRETLDRPGADLLVLHVFETLTADLSTPSTNTEDAIEELKLCTQQAMQAYADAHANVVLPHAEVILVNGRPAHEIVWAAAHFDVEVVVVGSHSRRGVGRLLMGSVAEKVMRLAGCPVTVVREKLHDPKFKLAEIEPLCPACAEARAATSGATLWCSMHSQRYPRLHVHSSGGRPDSPRAWSSTTGT